MCVAQIKRVLKQQLYDYSHARPHVALGGVTPKQRLAMAT